jgi:predicted MFS family arabinose efflux permease
MALAGFSSGAGMRLLDPLLPMVAQGFGTTVSASAILIAAFMLSYGGSQIIVGPLGDRLGKLRVVIVALTLYGAATAAAALAGTLAELAALRLLAGAVAGAVIPLLIAEIGDSVSYAERQAMLGRLMTGMVMAQLLAGPASGVIAEALGWRASFLVLGLFATGVAALLAALLWRRGGPRGAAGRSGLAGYAAMLGKPAARRLLALAFFDGLLLFGGAFPFVASFLIESFGLTSGMAGLVAAGFGLGALAYPRLARWLLQRFGEAGLLRLGAFGMAILLVALALVPGWIWAAPIQIALGLGFYMFHGVLQARATEVLPEARGTAVSAFALVLFLGQTVGALIFAGVIAAGGYRLAFFAAAAGAMGLAAVAARSGRG